MKNPHGAGRLHPDLPLTLTSWQVYALTLSPPWLGENEATIRIVSRPPKLAAQLDLQVEDVELDVDYWYPNGPWSQPPGFVGRT